MLTREEMVKIAQMEDPVEGYRQLAKKLRQELPSGRAVYDLFLAFSLTINDDEDQFFWEPLFDAMDQITGWCSPDRRLFPNEVI